LEIAALVMWVFTAGAGLRLLSRRLSEGGVRRQGTKVTRYPAMVVIGHPALAVAALATWIAFLITDRSVYAWSAFAALVLVALLGFTMFTRWLTADGKHARDAEQVFPAVAVVAHGAVAALTFVLVLFTAVTVSRG
jgi:phosphatidylserine synthase